MQITSLHGPVKVCRDSIYHFLYECIKNKDINSGRYVYSLMICAGLDSVVILNDLLIRLFGSCGQLEESNLIFERIQNPSVYTWNAMISAHAELGNLEKAVSLYNCMQQHGIAANKFVYLSVLKLCSSVKSLKQGRIIHRDIKERGYMSDIVVGNTVIDMYTKCQSLNEARAVFDLTENKDLVSWSIMVSGYANNGQVSSAIDLFLYMQHQGVLPNEGIFVTVLKLCSHADFVGLVHSQIVQEGFESVTIITNVLIDTYSTFARISEAFNLSDSLLKPDIVSWGSLIACQIQHGNALNALKLFRELQLTALFPSNVILSSVLKGCGTTRDLQQGRQIHCEIILRKLQSDLVIGNTLIDMYAKCGSAEEAHKTFDQLLSRDDVSWGTIFNVYGQKEDGLVTLNLLEQMRESGAKPNKVVYLCVLKACAILHNISKGQEIHDEIIGSGHYLDDTIGSSLIDMYAKCGRLYDAQNLFDALSCPDVVSWGALITGYTQEGDVGKVLQLLHQMQVNGIKPDALMFSAILTVYKTVKPEHDTNKIEEIIRILHEQIVFWGYEQNPLIGNALIEIYGDGGYVIDAIEVFHQLEIIDTVSWNLMMAVYVDNGYAHLALKHIMIMLKQGIKFQKVMVLHILKADSILGNLADGWLSHQWIITDGFDCDVVVSSTLIDMYAKCGSLDDACEIFNKIPNNNMVSYGAMIAGFVQHGLYLDALELFKTMECEGIQPTEATYACCLKACGAVGDLDQGRILHKQLFINESMNVVTGSALIDMYGKCGNLDDACKVFNEMPIRNNITWGFMIALCAENNYGNKSLELFHRMQQEGFKPTKATFLSALHACSNVGALRHVRLIQHQIIRKGFNRDVVLGNAIIDCYSRCGSMSEAHAMFGLQEHDSASWTALIVGYAHCSDTTKVHKCLETMRQEGFKFDDVLFMNILTACRHSGLFEEGCQYFRCMVDVYGIEPTVQHYNCMIDLLSRAGYVQEAVCLLMSMHLAPDVVTWRSLLNCSTVFQDKQTSFQCFDEVSRLDAINGSAYVLISNMQNETLQHVNVDNYWLRESLANSARDT